MLKTQTERNTAFSFVMVFARIYFAVEICLPVKTSTGDRSMNQNFLLRRHLNRAPNPSERGAYLSDE